MKFFIGVVIGVLIGIFYIALVSSSSNSDAYIQGANDYKKFVIRRLTEMHDHADNVTLVQLMEELK